MSNGNLSAVDYPKDFSLWNNEIPDDQKLNIINREDFPEGDILAGLGISHSPLIRSFGISNQEEIEHRLQLSHFLMRNRRLRRWVTKKAELPTMPSDKQKFLNWYDKRRPHTDFWKEVYCFLDLIDQSPVTVPSRLWQFAETLKKGLKLERMDRKLGAEVSVELEKAAEVRGLVTFSLETKVVSEQESDAELLETKEDKPDKFLVKECTLSVEGEQAVVGHREFSSALNQVLEEPYAKWTEWKWNPAAWFFGAISKRRTDRINEQAKEDAYRGMVINDLSSQLVNDLSAAIKNIFNQYHWSSKLSGALVTVSFEYDKDGLRLQIVKLVSRRKLTDDLRKAQIAETVRRHSQFSGYNDQDQRLLSRIVEDFVMSGEEARRAIFTNHLMVEALRHNAEFFVANHEVKSPETDYTYQWFALENVLNSQRFVENWREISQYQDFFHDNMRRLRAVATVISTIIKKSEELRVPLCIPTITSNRHVVAFSKLWPIQLLFRLRQEEAEKKEKSSKTKVRVVPISHLPELNGQMVALSGHHGGGKTETLRALATYLYLAHSGLPVFGTYFHFNVKKVLGLLFITQRGEGSTIQILVDKIKNILKAIENVPGSQVVLVLDEVGTGTQEMAGLQLGSDLLNKVHNSHISALFSTQITDLIDQATKRYNALPFQLTRRHEILPGIGDGGMNELLDETGLSKLLKS